MTVRPLFAWYDLWVGAYWDRAHRRLYVLPLPCIGFVVQFPFMSPQPDSSVPASTGGDTTTREDA